MLLRRAALADTEVAGECGSAQIASGFRLACGGEREERGQEVVGRAVGLCFVCVEGRTLFGGQ